MTDKSLLLEVKGLKKYFSSGYHFLYPKTRIPAVDNVSFTVQKGETMGLVGESGCGKSTLGRTIIRLYKSSEGEIWFDGNNISQFKEKEMRSIRKRMQMVFQNHYASLNGRMTVGDSIGEALDIHKLAFGHQRREIIEELLHKVGLNTYHASRYPHEFSGGQCQRVSIARALAVNPDFIICDEPISALDVSVQAQIINLLKDLQEEKGLTYLFIAHDLSMIRYISDKIGVMHLGRLVEIAKSKVLYSHPLHPYTRDLIASMSLHQPKVNNRMRTENNPSLLCPPSGCRFRTQCQYARPVCIEKAPKMREVSLEHFAACHIL